MGGDHNKTASVTAKTGSTIQAVTAYDPFTPGFPGGDKSVPGDSTMLPPASFHMSAVKKMRPAFHVRRGARQEYSANFGISRGSTYQGAREPQKMLFSGRMPGSSSSNPAGIK